MFHTQKLEMSKCVFEITQIQCKKNVFLDLSFFALEKVTNQIRIVSRLICESLKWIKM